MNTIDIEQLGEGLYQALRNRRMLAPLSTTHPDLTLDDAYAISQCLLQHRIQKDGERVIGKKIGVTSKAVQDMLGVFQPDFGFLTDAMRCDNGGVIDIAQSLIQPRIEAEIAFELATDLVGSDITPQQVLAATACIYPCFEIVDSRIQDWNITITDTVADNASCGYFVLGTPALNPQELSLELDKVAIELYGDGVLIHSGVGAAVQGNPLQAVAWLANTLARYNIPFYKGEIILSGSLVPLLPVESNQAFELKLWRSIEDAQTSGASAKTPLADAQVRFA